MRKSGSQNLCNVGLLLAALTALGFAIAGLVLAIRAQHVQPLGYGNMFTEASPNVNMTEAPGVTSLVILMGFSLFQSGAGFGSMSGQIVVGSPGPQTIVISQPLSIIAGSPIVIGSIPGLIILAVDNTTTYPVQFVVSPTQYDVTLIIPDITVGTWFFTQPFFGASA